jgi:putative ubiquitin-RnfH superfamily antitoxin RatB of RatAB toxin-antitoxin module
MATTDNCDTQRNERRSELLAESRTASQIGQKADQKAEPQVEQGAGIDSGALAVSVIWASLDQVSSVSLVVPVGTQVVEAIELSGLLDKYQPAGVAVFGQRCEPTRILSNGDRIELCRPLVVEPKAARRRRALHREKVRNIKKKMPLDDLTV